MTPRRWQRLHTILDRRQPDLTVLMDQVQKTRNASAILRSCDAVGVLEAHAVWPEPEIALHRLTSGSAVNWVPVHTHREVGDAVALLRARGLRVLAAHACPTAHGSAAAVRPWPAARAPARWPWRRSCWAPSCAE